MNILIVANIAPFETGGAEVQVRMLAEHWLRKKHNVTIIGNRIPSCEISIEDCKSNIKCYHISTFNINKLTRALSYIFSLSNYLIRKQVKFDVIYCRFLQEAAFVISLLKAIKIISLPVIACPASSGRKGDASFIKNFYCSKLISCLVSSQCNIINIISQEIAKELISIGIDENRFSYIPNGVFVPAIKRNVEKKHHSIKKMIFTGRLVEQKGLIFLLQAMKKIFDTDHHIFYLTIIGDGPEKNQLEKLVQSLGLSQYVTFYGKVIHREINNHLIKHDIFVLPSLYEGSPNALLEAMAIGLPSLVTICGGSEYLVDNTVGRVAKAGNIDSLANALKELLEISQEELHAMGMTARVRVEEKFDINIIADQYLQLFEQHIE